MTPWKFREVEQRESGKGCIKSGIPREFRVQLKPVQVLEGKFTINIINLNFTLNNGPVR